MPLWSSPAVTESAFLFSLSATASTTAVITIPQTRKIAVSPSSTYFALGSEIFFCCCFLCFVFSSLFHFMGDNFYIETKGF